MKNILKNGSQNFQNIQKISNCQFHERFLKKKANYIGSDNFSNSYSKKILNSNNKINCGQVETILKTIFNQMDLKKNNKVFVHDLVLIIRMKQS